jgi:glyoxylase-like metal-dependent hydrolase (beta-lactamase superfamily II)
MSQPPTPATEPIDTATLRTLGLRVLERGWLSSNSIVFAPDGGEGAAVVDTGYAAHAEQTVALVAHALGSAPLARIVNTHLHSDHCGGNAALQAAWDVRTAVPAVSLPAVQRWDEARLSYRDTGQRCERFAADEGLLPGDRITLGPAPWQVLAAPGHDPDAVMFFEPQTRTLISGDALWQHRLAIIFPELLGADGFGPTEATLAAIDALNVALVIPGHGAPFGDVAAAIAASRRRLARHVRSPALHAWAAARSLAMFHLMEHGGVQRAELVAWMLGAPLLREAIERFRGDAGALGWVASAVASLVDDGVVRAVDGDRLLPAGAA